MKRFILNCEPDKNGRFKFEGDDYRYLAKVRRLAPGESFPALLPGGAEVLLRVSSVDTRALAAEVSGVVAKAAEHVSPLIFLFQALPKGDKMDLIVRQAAECALAEIVPFVSEFSIAKAGGAQKFSRWEKLIKEARQQSGSAVATVVRQPVSIDGAFAYWEEIKARYPGVFGLLFHHLPLANETLHGYLGRNGKAPPVALAIGPEGGFSPAEADRFAAAGFRPFTVGGGVMRTETAALYAVAAIQILLLERDSWKTN